MAVNLAGGSRVSQMREGQPLVNGSVHIWNQIGRATGAQAISLWVMEFAPGQSPGIRTGNCDQILYVLRPEAGTARVSGWVDLLIDGLKHEVVPDTGIYLRPNQIFSIDNHDPDPIILISAQCPEPDVPTEFIDVPVHSAIDASECPPLVRLADRRAQPTADRWYRVLVDEEVGSTQVTQFVGSIPPGRAPDHFHNYEEVLFILKGEGRMWAGDSHTSITEGSCIYLPKGQVHCVENTGKGELRLLGMFYPAGSPSVRYDA